MNTTGELFRPSLQGLDFQEIMILDQGAFPRSWNKEQWSGLDPHHHLLFSWKLNGKLAGFALFHTPDNETAHLLKFCIEPLYRRQGQAGAFLKAFIPHLKSKSLQRIFLEVGKDNVKAVGFYMKSGFRTLRHIKSYYSDGEDGIIMELML